MDANTTIFLRTRTHRGRHKLAQALGRKPQYHYTFDHGGVFAEITRDEYEQVRSLLTDFGGISVARIAPHRLMRCW